MMKICSRCGSEKSTDAFSAHPHGRYGLYGHCKACVAELARIRRAAFPEKAKAIKMKYYASDKGKACKKREETAFRASGGRAATEAKRNLNISEARKQAKLRYQLMRASGERVLPEFDLFVLREAVRLRKLREASTSVRWHVDHVNPVSKGGTSMASNLQVVPARWNREKSNKHNARYFASAQA
jgi:hypothetical protein